MTYFNRWFTIGAFHSQAIFKNSLSSCDFCTLLKTWEKEKMKNFNNLLWGNYLPNWWVEFKLKGHWKNWRVGQFSIFWACPAQIWQVKKEVGLPAHCTRISTQILTIFFLFFLIQLPSYVSLLSGLKHWKPADEVFSSYPAATTVLKDYAAAAAAAAAHWSNCEKNPS